MRSNAAVRSIERSDRARVRGPEAEGLRRAERRREGARHLQPERLLVLRAAIDHHQPLVTGLLTDSGSLCPPGE